MTSCVRASQLRLQDSQKEEIFTLLSTGGCLSASSTCEIFLFLQVFTEYVSHNSWPKGLKAPQTSCEPIFLHKHKLRLGRCTPARTHRGVWHLFVLSSQTSPGWRGVSCGSTSWGPQTRGSFLCSLPGNRAGSCHFKGSSPGQTRLGTPRSLGISHSVPGLACVHTSSINVNKCIKTLPLGLQWMYPNRKIHLPWERRDCRTAAKLPLAFQGGTSGHCQALPAEQTCRRAGPEATHALQPPDSIGVKFWATDRAPPQEIPKGQIKWIFLFNFPHTVHCLKAAWYTCSMKSPPTPWAFFLVSSQPHQHCFFILSVVDHLTFHGSIRSKKKETWISYKVNAVPQIYFSYCKSMITEDPWAKNVQEILCNLPLVQGIS